MMRRRTRRQPESQEGGGEEEEEEEELLSLELVCEVVIIIIIIVLLLFLLFYTSPPSSSYHPPHLPSSLVTNGTLHLHLLLINLLLLFFSPNPTSSPSSRKRKTSSSSFHPSHQPHHKQPKPSPSSSSSSSSSSSASYITHTHDMSASATSFLSASLSDSNSFVSCFRMTPSTFNWLSGLLDPLLECRDPAGSSLNLSPDVRLAVGLFRLSTGSPYADVSRSFCVSPSTARFCTKQLCRVLCTNFRFWVSFPVSDDLRSVSAAFQALSGLPHCCGILDCTRFSVVARDDSRGSIVAQIVADSSSRILSIVTGFRGEKGDFAVLKSSSLYEDVQAGQLLNSPPIFLAGVAVPQYLIAGEGGYPLLPWLMVPFATSAHASDEHNFNAVLRSMHRPALRTLASLRNWGILKNPIEEEISLAVACIGACSILHNVLLMREDYSALSHAGDDYLVHRQRSQDSSLEHCFIDNKAHVIRSALAARTREGCRDLCVKNEELQ